MDNMEVLAQAGVKLNVRTMPNGEQRISLMDAKGNGYIKTTAGLDGGWQNAHYHRGSRESYSVISGWMAFVDIDEQGKRRLRVLFPDDSEVSSEPDVPHNVYLPAGASINTVKWGTAVGNPDKDGADWYPADSAFDVWTKGLTIEEIARLSGVSLDRLVETLV